MAPILQSQIRIPWACARQQLMMDWFPNTDPTATHGGLVSQYRSNSNSWWIGFPIHIQQQLMVDWFPNTDPTATHGGLVSQYRSNRALNASNEGAPTTWAGRAFHVPTIGFRKNWCATVVRFGNPSSLRPLWRTQVWWSTGKSTEESTRLTPSKYMYVSINWPLRRRCSSALLLFQCIKSTII